MKSILSFLFDVLQLFLLSFKMTPHLSNKIDNGNQILQLKKNKKILIVFIVF